MKNVPLFPKIKHRKRLKLISKTLRGKKFYKNKDNVRELANGAGLDYHCDTEQKFSTETFINIFAQKGLDLILNVLNNAITLHKRFSESKQLCVPSKR